MSMFDQWCIEVRMIWYQWRAGVRQLRGRKGES